MLCWTPNPHLQTLLPIPRTQIQIRQIQTRQTRILSLNHRLLAVDVVLLRLHRDAEVALILGVHLLAVSHCPLHHRRGTETRDDVMIRHLPAVVVEVVVHLLQYAAGAVPPNRLPETDGLRPPKGKEEVIMTGEGGMTAETECDVRLHHPEGTTGKGMSHPIAEGLTRGIVDMIVAGGKIFIYTCCQC